MQVLILRLFKLLLFTCSWLMTRDKENQACNDNMFIFFLFPNIDARSSFSNNNMCVSSSFSFLLLFFLLHVWMLSLCDMDIDHNFLEDQLQLGKGVPNILSTL